MENPVGRGRIMKTAVDKKHDRKIEETTEKQHKRKGYRMAVRIIGTGSAIPDRIVKNEELETFLDTSDVWIKERTGITSRHAATTETTTSLAAEACRRALENDRRRLCACSDNRLSCGSMPLFQKKKPMQVQKREVE
jgi:hypothetical protein